MGAIVPKEGLAFRAVERSEMLFPESPRYTPLQQRLHHIRLKHAHLNRERSSYISMEACPP